MSVAPCRVYIFARTGSQAQVCSLVLFHSLSMNGQVRVDAPTVRLIWVHVYLRIEGDVLRVMGEACIIMVWQWMETSAATWRACILCRIEFPDCSDEK